MRIGNEIVANQLGDNYRARHERHEMDTATKPSVLFVYYSYTKQTLKVVETMAGCSEIVVLR
jgi:hypothetical protein